MQRKKKFYVKIISFRYKVIYWICFLCAGEEEWGGQCQNGRRQSPIDLAYDAAVTGFYPSLYFRNYETPLDNAKIRNTGHSRK